MWFGRVRVRKLGWAVDCLCRCGSKGVVGSQGPGLTGAVRERLYESLTVLSHCIIRVDPDEIDRRGVGEVLLEAHSRAIQGALDAHRAKGHTQTPLVIIDGSRGVQGAVALPKADALIPAVSAASVIGKVFHDRIMAELDRLHPGYGLTKNSGYGTPKHREALDRLGVSPVHRLSYSPMSDMKPRDAAPQDAAPQDLFALFEAIDS
jgi:ribonuclease HII